MSNAVLKGNASGTGTVTLETPNTNTDRTISIPDAAGSMVLDSATQTLTNKTIEGGTIISGTAVSASGTSITFTGIPSWAKKITFVANNLHTTGAGYYIIRIGSGSLVTSGYASTTVYYGPGTAGSTITTGFNMWRGGTSEYQNFIYQICLISGTTWIGSGVGGYSSGGSYCTSGGGYAPALSGALDRVSITTSDGATFDTGSVNILYE